jgi:unsaturated rhamnogalacturonyl hydrolase
MHSQFLIEAKDETLMKNKLEMIYLFGWLLISTLLSCGPSHKMKTSQPWSVRMADQVMKCNHEPWTIDSANQAKWEYTYGLVLKGILEVWGVTGNERYLRYVQSYYDHFIQSDGTILTYKLEDYNIDRINTGRPLFTLHRQIRDEKYIKAIHLLRKQMKTHPRNSENGFWHKKIYPDQMWLDGIYMAGPFLSEYATRFNEAGLFDDVVRQVTLIEKHAREEKTGLLYHGWDESRKEKWADPETGLSSHFWGRGMGWYSMAIVDILDFLPENHAGRAELVSILNGLAKAITNVQDKETGVWYQILDQGTRKGNYLESSASCMFVYALAKGVRKGYLHPAFLNIARKGYQGILKQFIQVDRKGNVNIRKACAVAGLGGKPYRDGSFDYYIHEKIRKNDPKAVGPFILASIEMEMLGNTPGQFK